VWSTARLLAWTRDFFERRDVEQPRLCAEILLAHALGCERIELYTRHDAVPAAPQRDAFRALVRQAADGAPIAYLTGTKDFFSLTFEVTPAVLVPRPETEILVERVIHLARQPGAEARRVLDVGAGSGCIIVSLAKHLPEAEAFASDISPPALGIARRNAARHGVAERIDFRIGDLLAPWAGFEFDVIVSNPPYVALRDANATPRAVRDFEPHVALFGGDDGLVFQRRLADEALASLRAGGHLFTEVAFDQADAVRGLFERAGWKDIVTYRDGLRHERVVHARRGA
jgi:release factor glutamine methyltransferase